MEEAIRKKYETWTIFLDNNAVEGDCVLFRAVLRVFKTYINEKIIFTYGFSQVSNFEEVVEYEKD